MDILFVSPEVFPFAKTGGLADVIGALPSAISKRGHNCSVILPFYKCVIENGFSPKVFKENISLEIENKEERFSILSLKQGDISVYFVEKGEYYNREYLYGTPRGDYSDNAVRFGFFAKAVISSIPHIGRFDIVHCNDWQTALIPLYIRLFHKEEARFIDTKLIFTIHNMAYQGLFERKAVVSLGIPEGLFSSDYLEFYGKLNFMKAGIIYSDVITTVSKGYRREILTSEFGCGLDGLLRTRERDIYGIVNGVDYSVWDPKIDRFIAKRYSEQDLAAKQDCKRDLLKEFGIKYEPERPLIGMITRLAEQKGIDLVRGSMADILKLGADFVILGFGDKEYNDIFKHLAEKYSVHLGVRIDFKNALAHKIEAGSDIFLMPSRYEPCGLNQLYSLKYATVPVVRAVGGLDDTVRDFDISTEKGNGFKFKEASCEALLGAVGRAIRVYKDKPLWNVLLHNCLSCDYSWASSAEEYERLYRKILGL